MNFARYLIALYNICYIYNTEYILRDDLLFHMIYNICYEYKLQCKINFTT